MFNSARLCVGWMGMFNSGKLCVVWVCAQQWCTLGLAECCVFNSTRLLVKRIGVCSIVDNNICYGGLLCVQ